METEFKQFMSAYLSQLRTRTDIDLKDPRIRLNLSPPKMPSSSVLDRVMPSLSVDEIEHLIADPAEDYSEQICRFIVCWYDLYFETGLVISVPHPGGVAILEAGMFAELAAYCNLKLAQEYIRYVDAPKTLQ